VALWALAGSAVAGDMLFESAELGGTGLNQGSLIGAQEYLGVRFEATEPWRVEAVGGHMFQNEGGLSAFFAAIIPLEDELGYPTDQALSEAVWFTTFTAGELSSDIFIPGLTYLQPGWYVLMFGGGGLFGSTGSGGMTTNNTDIGYPTYLRLRQGEWEPSPPGKRFFVYGTVACIEDTANLTVDCAEDCADGYDNDADGWVDCQDDNCWALERCCDADEDGWDRDEELCSFGGDCDDRPIVGLPIHPGASETPLNGVDEDCDGLETCYADADLDGFGSMSTLISSDQLTCSGAPGISTQPTDCQDAGPGAADVNPLAIELAADGVDQDCDGRELCYEDLDGDGFGSFIQREVVGLVCDGTPGFSSNRADCDDFGPAAATFFPGASEPPADGIDQDCDGVDDCYVDRDGDGWGVPEVVTGTSMDCSVGRSTANNALDCLDVGLDGLLVNPGAQEVPADGVDQDCDGLDACFEDLDGDGYGSSVIVRAGAVDCAAAFGLSWTPGDCDDSSPIAAQVYPGAQELAGDGVDQDCNNADDCFFDVDRDGYGGPFPAPAPGLLCDTLEGYASSNDDCLDVGPRAVFVHPGAPEDPADGVDQDCDGEDACFADLDLDGFGGTTLIDAGDLSCVDDPGERPSIEDCDDGDPDRSPAEFERPGDGVDQNCDGVDACYEDQDQDGWGSVRVIVGPRDGCESAPGFAAVAGDCDDQAEDVHPGAEERPYDGVDQDCVAGDRLDVDNDGSDWIGARGQDCDDTTGTVRPGAVELVNDIDDNCDGRIDEGSVRFDDDGDGYAELGGDCDDAAISVRPGAIEVCDGRDQDCDGAVDEGTRCRDDDLDGYSESEGDCADGDPARSPGLVDIPDNGIDDDCDGVMLDAVPDVDGDGYAVAGGDCAPFDASVFPHAEEAPDGIDDDCDGLIDEGTIFFDDDGDGYAEAASDCNDAQPLDFPGAAERADGVDNDCDGEVDEGLADLDRDGAVAPEDCDDGDALVGPGVAEVPNGRDDDCDGEIDDGVDDRDGDGWTREGGDCHDGIGWVNPEAIEVCDGVDNDCDGAIDPGCAERGEVVAQPAPTPSTGCSQVGGGVSSGVAFGILGLVRGRRSGVRGKSANG
jgi:hypothetical protein